MGTVRLPAHSLTIDDVNGYAHKLNIPNYIGCFMIDELPSTPQIKECGIFNLEPSSLQGSHWVCWYKNTDSRIYFDSFGETPPPEIIQYLKTKKRNSTVKTCYPTIICHCSKRQSKGMWFTLSFCYLPFKSRTFI